MAENRPYGTSVIGRKSVPGGIQGTALGPLAVDGNLTLLA